MHLDTFYDPGIGRLSHLVSSRSGEALIVDPTRDIDRYLDRLHDRESRLTAVVETHLHAEHLSGGRALARATGSRLYLSAETPAGWEFGGLGDLDVQRLEDGSTFWVGELRLEAIHTPGPAPEHFCLSTTDGGRGDRPKTCFTGDVLSIDALGGLDPLEEDDEEARPKRGRQWFESLRNRLAELPDHVEIRPSRIGEPGVCEAEPPPSSSTIGYERRQSWWSSYVEEYDVEGFITELLESQSDPLPYASRMRRANRDGVEGGWSLPTIERLTPNGLERALDRGGRLLDLRSLEAFADGHRDGSLHLPNLRALSDHAARLLEPDVPLILWVEPERLESAKRRLYRVGLGPFVGWVPHVSRSSLDRSVELVDADTAREAWEFGDARLLDVRSPAEHHRAHIPGSIHIPLDHLADRIDELPRNGGFIVHSQIEDRASIALSLLEDQGVERLALFRGGLEGWRAAGYPVEEGG
jgi:hydroxyacylglutathione hydrolase